MRVRQFLTALLISFLGLCLSTWIWVALWYTDGPEFSWDAWKWSWLGLFGIVIGTPPLLQVILKMVKQQPPENEVTAQWT